MSRDPILSTGADILLPRNYYVSKATSYFVSWIFEPLKRLLNILKCKVFYLNQVLILSLEFISEANAYGMERSEPYGLTACNRRRPWALALDAQKWRDWSGHGHWTWNIVRSYFITSVVILLQENLYLLSIHSTSFDPSVQVRVFGSVARPKGCHSAVARLRGRFDKALWRHGLWQPGKKATCRPVLSRSKKAWKVWFVLRRICIQAFWAANFGREHILLELYHLGIDLNEPCERYGKDAEFVCGMRGNHSAVDRVNALRRRREDLATKAQVHIIACTSLLLFRSCFERALTICARGSFQSGSISWIHVSKRGGCSQNEVPRCDGASEGNIILQAHEVPLYWIFRQFQLSLFAGLSRWDCSNLPRHWSVQSSLYWWTRQEANSCFNQNPGSVPWRCRSY